MMLKIHSGAEECGYSMGKWGITSEGDEMTNEPKQDDCRG
jgi:hypothetical protein